MYDLPPALQALTDDEWLDGLLQAATEPGASTAGFPTMPRAADPTYSVAGALRDASVFYRIVKAYCDALAMPLGQHRRVLDFGMGWGCLARFYIRDVAAANLYGCEFDPALLAVGREGRHPGSSDRLYPKGKLPYPDDYFDCITASAAFARMGRAPHLHWMHELARVAAPGCVFTFTVEPRRSLDAPADFEAFDRGEIVQHPDPAHPHSGVHGHAAVPMDFIRRHWRPPFELRDAIDEAHRFARAVVIVQHA